MGEKTFISYAREDSAFALRLAHDLRAAGVDLWLDQLDIRPGDMWDSAVEEALQECSGLLVVLSPDSVASRSVMDEVSYALEESRRVIPVIHRECKLPFRLRRVQYTDLTSDYAGRVPALVRALGGTPPIPAGHGLTGAGVSPRDVATAPTSAPAPRPLDTSPAGAGDPRDAEALSLQPGHVPPDPIPGSQPPRPEATRPPGTSRRPRLDTALKLGAGNALLASLAVMTIGPPGARTSEVLLAGVIAGLAWACAGAIAGPRKVPLRYAAATALFAFLAGMVVLQNLGDDEWLPIYALIFATPVGGILGAVIGAVALRTGGGIDQRKAPRAAPE